MWGIWTPVKADSYRWYKNKLNKDHEWKLMGNEKKIKLKREQGLPILPSVTKIILL